MSGDQVGCRSFVSRDSVLTGGCSLAQAELYLTVAMVSTRFDFELHETDAYDVVMKHAYLVPYPKWESKGVRAKVKSLQ